MQTTFDMSAHLIRYCELTNYISIEQILSPHHITAIAYNWNINKRLAHKLVWPCKTIVEQHSFLSFEYYM